ncbi:unnamed protein product [Cunninghamella blakesleeana]
MGFYKYSLLDEGPKTKRHLVRVFIFLLTIGILLAIVIPTYLAYSTTQNMDNKVGKSFAGYSSIPPYTIGNQPGNFTSNDGSGPHTTAEANILITLNTIDPIAGTAKVHVQLLPNQLENNTIPNYIYDYNPNYTFYVNGELKNITSTTLVTNWNFPVTLDGDNGAYPFDQYIQPIFFQFYPGETFTGGITVNVVAFGAQSGWDVKFTVDYDDGLYTINPTVTRNVATKGFSLFVITISWVLTLCQLFISCQAVLRNRPTITLLSVPAALLFALPNLRNVQPGVPPVGIYLDFAGFFWNMVIVALSLITSSILYIFQFDVNSK